MSRILFSIALLVAVVCCGSVQAQGFGRGPMGKGGGRGPDADHMADMQVFHFLLQNHDKIKRTVKKLDNGVETLTESDDPEVAKMIQKHVVQMTARIEKVSPIRMRDPLFAELFRNAKKVKIEYEDTSKGVLVTETSNDAYVVKLLQAHAEVVSKFVKNGFAEAMKTHPVPAK